MNVSDLSNTEIIEALHNRGHENEDIAEMSPAEVFDVQAMSAMKNQMFSAFRDYLVDIRGGSQLRTKLAADIATKLSEGFISPIAAKIDPVTLGEHQRATQIAFDYGARLIKISDSLDEDSLVSLVTDYPSHGFVIDRKEASELFRRVDKPDETTIDLYDWMRSVIRNRAMPSHPIILDVREFGTKLEPDCDGNLEANESEPNPSQEEDHGSESDNSSATPEDESAQQNGVRSGDDSRPKARPSAKSKKG